MQKADLSKYELPDVPGVYKFLGEDRVLLYIGMATSLKSRVRSYFAPDLVDGRGAHIVKMVEDARSIEWEATDSVLEAMILEANLIKKYQPPANSRDRDNKSFNYLVITEESFPRVLTVRGRELFQKWEDKDIRHVFGPFPEGGSLKEAVKLVRKIFPFRDTCAPCAECKTADFLNTRHRTSGKNTRHPMSCKPCFNRQIGLCPGVCDGSMGKRAYGQVIRHIALLFSGKKGALIESLTKSMTRASRQQHFEEAQAIRRQISALTHIHDVALIRRDAFESKGGDVNQFRIEAYDIAHTSGTETVGVFTVVENGEPKKSDYRMFKVKGFKNDDTGALKEVLSRRLGHAEWPMPRLIVIDGGKGQLNAAARVLADAGVQIPLVAVVKDERHRPREIIGDEGYAETRAREILAANAEAHRFAIAYHKKRRRRALL